MMKEELTYGQFNVIAYILTFFILFNLFYNFFQCNNILIFLMEKLVFVIIFHQPSTNLNSNYHFLKL